MGTPSARPVGFFVPYFAVLIAALVWANLEAGITRLGPRRSAFLLLVGVAAAWVAVRAYAHLRGLVPQRWHHWGAAVDTAIITVAVYLTGYATSETFLLYFWPIATSSIARLPGATVAVGTASVACYVLATWPYHETAGYATAVTFRAIILLMTTALAAYNARTERTLVEEVARLREGAALADYRTRLSRELHDGIQHYLVSIAARLELARSLMGDEPAEAARLATDQRFIARQAVDELRYAVKLLRAPAVEREGFIEALRHHLASRAKASSLAVPLEVAGEVRTLPPELAHAAFRIIQEAITNIEKHANAREARVALDFSHNTFGCAIVDDGVGFDPSRLPEQPSVSDGFGLSLMKERAESVGGELHVLSRRGEGTKVAFKAPLPS